MAQFVGSNWPVSKREEIADLLFSNDTKSDGSPVGIGLSSWRFNIGAGSAEQGAGSGILDEWRRAEGLMQADGSFDWDKQQGQRWFLQAAKERGVEQFFGFINSPPIALTKNGKAYSNGGSSSNLAPGNYDAFTMFIVEVLDHLKTNDGIEITFPENYITESINGKVSLYRPSNQSLDFDIAFVLSKRTTLLIPDNKLVGGRWDIKISWSENNKEYLYKKELVY